MHHDEMWQVYAPNGEAIPGEGWNSALDNPEVTGAKEIVGVVVVFLYRRSAKGIELLWQKRAMEVDRYPGDYDISAGGHVNLGESLVEAAVRETYEEIGVKITPDDLHFVTMRGFNNNNRFAWVYAVDFSKRMEEFCFNDHEVSEVRWVDFDKTEEFRLKYAKAPLKKDGLTFAMLEEWFRQNGDL